MMPKQRSVAIYFVIFVALTVLETSALSQDLPGALGNIQITRIQPEQRKLVRVNSNELLVAQIQSAQRNFIDEQKKSETKSTLLETKKIIVSQTNTAEPKSRLIKSKLNIPVQNKQDQEKQKQIEGENPDLFQSITQVNKPQKNLTKPVKDKRLWNLKDTDVRAFIHAVSEETGKNFVIDPRVNGKITFISSRPLNEDELYQAFLSALQVNSFVAIPNGSVIKIVPTFVAKGLSSPLYSDLSNKEGDSMAVSVVDIKYVPATELAETLNKFITQNGNIAAYAPTNDIIIADSAGNIDNLMRLIKQIDQQRSNKIDVVRLRNAQAKILVDTLRSVLGQSAQTDKQSKKMQAGISPTIDGDERTNSILISGGSTDQHAQIRSVISRLDTSSSKSGSVTEVIYIKHLSAERVATIVNALVQNYYDSTKSTSERKNITSSATTSSSSSSAQSNPANSLFNKTLGGNDGQSALGLYNNLNSINNDIYNIVATAPKSGSVSSNVQWEESTNSLIVTAPRDLMNQIRRVIAKIDIRRPQVLIEAVIAEVSVDREKELGIEFNTGGSVQFLTNFASILPLSTINSDGGLSQGQGMALTSNGNQIRMLIRALEKDSESNVLATPNLVTLDNEPAQIKVGSKISFTTSQIQNDPTGGNPINFFNREDVGLILTINPQITPNGSIKLLIQQELSTIIPNTNSAGSNPNTSERFVRTTVMADNGKILVLGGLLQNEWQENTSKIPYIDKIPVLGFLTRDRSKKTRKTNLMMFLRPTILYDEKDNAPVSGGKYEFLRQAQL